jgi:hypothetical protein
MVLVPMACDVHTAAHPHPVVLTDVVQEARQRRGRPASRMCKPTDIIFGRTAPSRPALPLDYV